MSNNPVELHDSVANTKPSDKASWHLGFHPIVMQLFIGTALSRIATSMTVPFLAIYLTQHSAMSATAIGLSVGSASLSSMVFGFFGGALSDRWGRTRVMLFALFVWSIVFFGFAINIYAWLFVALNLLHGLCRSCFEPVSVAMISDLTEPEKRYRAYSIRYIANNAGFAIGPVLGAAGGFVGGAIAFIVTGAFYLLYGSFLFILLKKYGVSHAASEKQSGNAKIGDAWKVVTRDRALGLFLLGGIIMQFTYTQLTTISPYVENHFHNGVWLYAMLMTTNAITVVCCQYPISLYMEKRSPLASVKVGNWLYALGGVGFAVSHTSWTMIGAMVVFSIGEVLCFPAGNTLTDRIAPSHLKGAYFGAQNFRDLGRFLGPSIGLPMLTHVGILPLFITMGVLTLISTWCYQKGERFMTVPLQSA